MLCALQWRRCIFKGLARLPVKEITQTLCGSEISSSQVSRIAQGLDGELNKWRERPLGLYKYLILDALYEKTRGNGVVVASAVLVAYGINPKGGREILGVSVSLSEQEVHWRAFLESLVKRGLHGVELITSDAHAGLKAAGRAIFPSVPWQRCQFHLQQNAQGYIPKKSMKEEVARDIRSIFNAPNKIEADRFLELTAKKYVITASQLSVWMLSNIPEGLTVMSFPEPHQKRLRTSNLAERMNREIRRRNRVVGIFPNTSACLRLISAVLVETNEEWSQEKSYLSMKM